MKNKVNENEYYHIARHQDICETLRNIVSFMSNLQIYYHLNWISKKWTNIQEASV